VVLSRLEQRKTQQESDIHGPEKIKDKAKDPCFFLQGRIIFELDGERPEE
jgi:hypothetical protein